MSANINYNKDKKQYSFYSLKEKAWHGLGQIVQEAKTSDEVIKLAHLDWTVEKLKVFCQYPLNSNFLDDKGIRLRGKEVNNLKVTVRMDTGSILGYCSDRYEVLNNNEAFNFIDNIVNEKLAIYETAGALGNGEIVFVTAKLPNYIKVTNSKDDIIEKYILFTTSHDGSGAVKAMFTPIRVVCNNTLNVALKNNTGRVNMRHTKNIQDKIKDARNIMQLYIDYDDQLTNNLSKMALLNLNDKQIDNILANTFLTSEQLANFNINGKILLSRDLPQKKLNQLIYAKDYIDAGPGQEYSRGTAYWLYNGITSYFNNGKEFNNNEERFLALTTGNESNISQKAFNNILNLI